MAFISYAQNYEDLTLWRALKHLETGFYVDVGAHDPIIDSVTCAFYEKGWRGINVEPTQEAFKKLSRQRPRDINLEMACGASKGQVDFFFVPDSNLSTLNRELAQKYTAEGKLVEKRSTQVCTLDQILNLYGPEVIHFLKIDVEGFEEQVIQGLDLTIWRPWIILIESTTPKSSDVVSYKWEQKILESRYRFACFDGLNKFFVADENYQLIESLQIPPNLFDNFLTWKELEVIHAANQLKQLLQDHDVEFYPVGNTNIATADEILHFAKHNLLLAASNVADLYNSLTGQSVTIAEKDNRIEEQRLQILELEQARDDLQKNTNAQLQGMNHRLHQANLRIMELVKEQHAIEQRLGQSNGMINQLYAHQSQMQQELSQSQSTIQQLQAELQKVYQSKSYRITAPMRWVFGHGRVYRERLKTWIGRIKESVRKLLVGLILILRVFPPIAFVVRKFKARYQHLWDRHFMPTREKIFSDHPQGSAQIPTILQSTSIDREEERYFQLFQREIAKCQTNVEARR